MAANPYETTDRPDVGEKSGLVNPTEFHREYAGARTVDWSEPHLRVTRLRLLSDPGHPTWDVSYCVGVIKTTGEKVRVQVPFSGGLLRKGRMVSDIVAWGRLEGVYVKGLGILDAISSLN